MKVFKHEITTPEDDRLVAFGSAIVALLLAMIPPYGMRTVTFVFLGAMNGFNGWRLHRKIVSARASQGHPDS